MGKDKKRVIALLSDFGLHDPYVAAMKGVILGINPHAHIVDISHHIESHDIAEASFLLMTTYSYFPPQSIHLVVVDPGVGSERLPLLVQTENYFFIAPDNGVLSFPLTNEKVKTAVEIKNPSYLLKDISSTFHGRDIFAPVAAWISKGVEVQEFGSVIEDYKKIPFPTLKHLSKGQWQAEVLHIDKFGNIISNIYRDQWEQLKQKTGAAAFCITINNQKITKLVDNYAEGKDKKLFALFGSCNFLEISFYCQSAAQMLKARRGDKIIISLE